MKDLCRRLSLLCPVCGNDQFESLDVDRDDLMDAEPDARFRCSDCGNDFTKEELLKENGELIEVAVKEVKQEVVKEFEKDLKKALKKLKL